MDGSDRPPEEPELTKTPKPIEIPFDYQSLYERVEAWKKAERDNAELVTFWLRMSIGGHG